MPSETFATACRAANARQPCMSAGEPHAEVELTRLDTILWPEDGLTKGDLIAYLRAVGPAMPPIFATVR
jgi:hypothetical protein